MAQLILFAALCFVLAIAFSFDAGIKNYRDGDSLKWLANCALSLLVLIMASCAIFLAGMTFESENDIGDRVEVIYVRTAPLATPMPESTYVTPQIKVEPISGLWQM
jgi:hypothetical protein